MHWYKLTREAQKHSPVRLTFLLCFFLAAGCATQDAQKRVEQVAKNWCNTIRASQVIPVFPLTADFKVGDVFLVQTPISTQAKQYQERGFLALDDHRCRLMFTNFAKLYFDGYWKDTYANTPHSLPVFTNSGPMGTNYVATTQAEAPRVMFPAYTFQAQSGLGLSGAFPIEGVPVALNYLRSDNVSGSVSISDARTYAGDEAELYSALKRWAADNETKATLVATAKNASPTVTFLRVVTRIYLARAVDVSLYRATQQKGGARAGNTPDVALLNSATNVPATNAFMAIATNILDLAQVGGAFKFTSVGDASVTLKQVFDQLLAVGYMGFDVPVYENGALGVPIPTFQRLESKPRAWIHPILDARQNNRTLRSIAKVNPTKAVRLLGYVAEYLQGTEFRLTGELLNQIKDQEICVDDKEKMKQLQAVLDAFAGSTFAYLSRPYWFSINPTPQRIVQYNSAFDMAWERLQSAAPVQAGSAASGSKGD